MKDHPTAVAQREARALKRDQRRVERAGINHAVQEHGIHFAHCGKLTIAYQKDRRDVISISTAICHPNDQYDKHTGRVQALEHFAEGKVIQLRKPADLSIPLFLEFTFAEI